MKRLTFLSHMKLGQKFLIYVIFLSVIPLMVVSASASTNASNLLQQESRRSALQLVSNKRDYLSLQLNQLETLLRNLAGADNIVKLANNVYDASDTYTALTIRAQIGYTLNTSASLPGLVDIGLYTIDGHYYHVGDTLDNAIVKTQADYLFEETFKANQGLVWFGLQNNLVVQSSFKRVAVITKGITTVFDGVEHPVAILIASYSLEAIGQTLRNVDLGQESTLLLIDTGNQILYHSDATEVGKMFHNFDVQAFQGSEGTMTETINGTSVLVTYSTLPSNNWMLLGFVPIDALNAKTASINTGILISFALALPIILLAAAFFRRNFVQPVVEVTERFRRLQGTQPDGLRMTERGRDEIGQLIRWFNAFLDALSERQKTEKERELLLEELNVLNQELEDRVKLRTHDLEIARHEAENANRVKSAFLASMSHELRTPLNAIINFTKFLIKGKMGPVSEAQIDALDKVKTSGIHLLNLINDVLDITKIESNSLNLLVEADVNLISIIERSVSTGQILLEDKPVEIRLEISPTLPIILGDKQRLLQVMLNILSNACKFTDEGLITIQAFQQEECVYVSVKDTGPGIPEVEYEAVFQAFKQTETGLRKGSGTGLGMPISKHLVEAHEGQLLLQSELGKGTTFTMILPIHSAKLELILI